MKTKIHSTNYQNTFIVVAPDCDAVCGTEPPSREPPSVAELTFRMIRDAPYAHTSDDVVFGVWATRNGVIGKARATARQAFFAKGQPCLRASDLTKKYGWGVHANADARIAVFGVETPEYRAFAKEKSTLSIKIAMRSTRK
jgi:Family of unknown function (DUF6157)